MEKFSDALKEKMRSTDPGKKSVFKVIITLSEDADWHEGVRLLHEAGLNVESKVEEIRMVSGSAEMAVVRNMAAIPAVELIELEGLVSTM